MFKTIAGTVTLAAALVFTPALPAVGNEKVPYYFTVHVGMDKYQVNDVVERWNRNPTVELVRVNSCASHAPCVDIWQKYDNRGYYQPRQVAGLFYSVTNENDPWQGTIYNIDMFTWWNYQWPNYSDRQLIRKRILCHELGHYLLGPASIPHPDHGCLSESGKFYTWPGEWNKAHVSDWWSGYNA